MGDDVHWLRYVDDELVIIPVDTNVGKKLRHLYEADNNIQFTVEHLTRFRQK